MTTVGVVVAGLAGFTTPPVDETAAAYIVELADGASVAAVVDGAPVEIETTETFDAVFEGFAAELTPSDAAELEALPEVVAVYEDLPMTVGATQSDAVWNLSRLDQSTAPADSFYTYPDSAGSGARVYVVDTGIAPNAGQLGTRLLPGYTAIADGNGTSDCQGHGTHVAGTVASTTWGVAKQASVVPVRVFGCSGGTSTSTVLSGLDWIAANHPAGTPGIINMSLGSEDPIAPSTPDALTSYVNNLVDLGFIVVVAAGNSGADACNYSPSRAAKAITVAATTEIDARASYSNYGSCVDLFAPGSNVRSLQWNNPSGSAMATGTSMATPHVSGIAALTLGKNPSMSGPAVMAEIAANAIPNAVATPGSGSPNQLASTAWLTSPANSFGTPTSIVARDNNGDLWLYPISAGRFAPRLSLGTGWSGYTSLTGAGDLDGDGNRDLVTISSGSAVNIHRGTAGGAFAAPEPVPGTWGGITTLFSPGDFTGDGRNDLLSRSAAGDLFLHVNGGNGTFAAPRQVGNGWSGLNPLFGAGDFTGDGSADVMGRDASGRLMLYSGNGRGGWRGATAIGIGWGGFTSIFSPGDVDGDGAADVLGRLPNGDLYLYAGDGRGGWKSARQVGWGWNVFTSVSGFGGGVSYPFLQSAGAGDVNRDGARDVVVATTNGDVFRYLGNGSGSWIGAARVNGQSFAGNRLIAGVGDINFSSTDDLIAVDNSGQLIHYDGDGKGGYATGTIVGNGWGEMSSVFIVGDGNGDRTYDLVARDTAGNAWFYPGTGPLTWGAPTQIASGWAAYTAVFPVGDFNGDKYPDIVARSSTGLLFLIAGTGTAQWKPGVQIGNGWQSMTSLHGPGDFNGDGRADVIARDATGNLWLYSGNGTGGWLGGRVIGWGWQGFRWIG